jgi:hypothetical protein
MRRRKMRRRRNEENEEEAAVLLRYSRPEPLANRRGSATGMGKWRGAVCD